MSGALFTFGNFKVQKPKFWNESFKVFGVEFAPLNVPFERRMQMLCVAIHCFGFILLAFSPMIIYYVIFHTSYWYLMVAYCIWVFMDRNTGVTTGRPILSLRSSSYYKHFSDYFPVKFVTTTNLPPDRNYILAYHPHSVFALSVLGSGFQMSKRFPKIHFMAATLNAFTFMPIVREYFLSLGAIGASENSLLYFLKNSPVSSAVLITPGGASEMLLTSSEKYRITIRKRKGFVRVALKAGTSLVPVFVFGENALLGAYPLPHETSLIHRTVRRWFGFPMYHTGKGRGFFQYTFGMLPRRGPINVIVGAPIELPKIENPTSEDVDKYHEIYKRELKKLFEDNRQKYEPSANKEIELIME